MEEDTSRFNWPDLIPKLRGWIMGLIAFVIAVAGFIQLWQGDTSLVTAVLLVVGVGGGWLGCAYLAFKRTPPLVEGGKGTWQYSRWRPWALAGLIAIPLLTAVALGSWWYTETHRPDQVVVLVADFYQEGTEEDPYGLTGIILGRLRDALAEEPTVSVRALQQPITAQQGGDWAREIGWQHLCVLTLGNRAIGLKRQTVIAIWGWYAVTEEVAWVDARFEVVRPPGGLPEIPLDGQAVALAELDRFDFQVQLSREMAFLTVFTVGLVHFEGGAHEAAIATFSRSLAQTEKLVKAVGQGAIYLYRGAAYLIEGEPVQAIADFDKAIALRPDFADAYLIRGVAYAEQGEYGLAIADYDKALELRPDYSLVYNNRGVAYADKGEYDLAIADYSKAIELEPEDAKAYNNRGVAYADKGEHDLAIADYDRAIEIAPQFAEAYVNRSTAYGDKGEHNLAIADLTKAIELRPGLAEA